MRVHFSLFPDFKLHFTYNFKNKKWYVRSGFPNNICGEGNSLIEAFNNTSIEIETYSKYTDNKDGRELIKSILQSRQYIEYIGEFYLCILNSNEDDWGIINVNRNNKFTYKIHTINYEITKIKELLELLNNISIKPFGQGGFDGKINRLTLGSGFNSSSITWWSGDEKKWEGLTPVIKKIKEIKEFTKDIS